MHRFSQSIAVIISTILHLHIAMYLSYAIKLLITIRVEKAITSKHMHTYLNKW